MMSGEKVSNDLLKCYILKLLIDVYVYRAPEESRMMSINEITMKLTSAMQKHSRVKRMLQELTQAGFLNARSTASGTFYILADRGQEMAKDVLKSFRHLRPHDTFLLVDHSD